MQADVTLLNSIKSMDKESLAVIFDRYAPALYNYVLRAGRDHREADQIVGDVFAKLLDQLSCGNGPRTNIRSYLFECAYHLIVDEVRYNCRWIPVEVLDLFRFDGQSADLVVEKQMLFDRIFRAIRNELNDSQRHVVVLRFLEGFSLRETASILGKSVNLVKVTQSRAIAILRKTLIEHIVE